MYQVRKCQTYSVTTKTKTANLDPEKFRKLSIPYEGNSEEEFVNYISDLSFDEICDELDEETLEELNKLFENAEWEEWHNSTWDGEEVWCEIGEENPEYSNSGGFVIRHSTHIEF
jgi:hypothetical protein